MSIITSLSPETFLMGQPQHYPTCDDQAIGAWVRRLSEMHGWGASFRLEEISDVPDADRPECSCFGMQLRAVEADLTVARKAQRAGYDKAAVIAELTARRDALRAAVAK